MAVESYTGKRTIQSSTGRVNFDRGICEVLTNNGKLLKPFVKTENGMNFEWGKHGALSWNLAKSIMRDYFQVWSLDEELPEKLVRRFYEDVVVSLDFMKWEIDETELKAYFTRVSNEEKILNENVG